MVWSFDGNLMGSFMNLLGHWWMGGPAPKDSDKKHRQRKTSVRSGQVRSVCTMQLYKEKLH